MPQTIEVPDAVREQLRLGLVRMDDFRPAVENAQLEAVPQPPGCFRAQIQLAVPRPLDPETAQVRRLDVFLRPVDAGYEVFSIRGLDLEDLGE
jgi:hypothetical protein